MKPFVHFGKIVDDKLRVSTSTLAPLEDAAIFESEEQAMWAAHIFKSILEIEDMYYRVLLLGSGKACIEVHVRRGPSGAEDEFEFIGYALRCEFQPTLS